LFSNKTEKFCDSVGSFTATQNVMHTLNPYKHAYKNKRHNLEIFEELHNKEDETLRPNKDHK